jgi:threonine dehydrogenase-like Zn-dependent dehydrogenase
MRDENSDESSAFPRVRRSGGIAGGGRRRPLPGEGQARVRVAATSFNGVDGKIRAGRMQGPMPLQLPHIPGLDVAGTVDALGEGVDRLQVGDPVIGFLPFAADGATAEYVLAAAASLAPAPSSIPLADAAALPVVGLSAWQALFEHADLQSGQRIFINGAGGAVGGYAVQLAKAAGAHVIATASPRTRARVETPEPTKSSTTPPARRGPQSPSRSTCCSTLPRSVRSSSVRWPSSSAMAGSSSTRPYGCRHRPTRRTA